MKSHDLKYRNFENTSLLHTLQNILKYYMNFFASSSAFYESLGNRIPIDLVIRLRPIRQNAIFEFAERFGFIAYQQLLMEKINK